MGKIKSVRYIKLYFEIHGVLIFRYKHVYYTIELLLIDVIKTHNHTQIIIHPVYNTIIPNYIVFLDVQRTQCYTMLHTCTFT